MAAANSCTHRRTQIETLFSSPFRVGQTSNDEWVLRENRSKILRLLLLCLLSGTKRGGTSISISNLSLFEALEDDDDDLNFFNSWKLGKLIPKDSLPKMSGGHSSMSL